MRSKTRQSNSCTKPHEINTRLAHTLSFFQIVSIVCRASFFTDVYSNFSQPTCASVLSWSFNQFLRVSDKHCFSYKKIKSGTVSKGNKSYNKAEYAIIHKKILMILKEPNTFPNKGAVSLKTFIKSGQKHGLLELNILTFKRCFLYP